MQKKLISFQVTLLLLAFMGLLPAIAQSQAFTDGTIDVIVTPVHLISFSANKVNNAVQVNWTTTNEINNSHFNVQRAFNVTDFITIGKVAGKGNMATINNYAFTDTAIPNTNLYYRLQQVDIDSKSTLSATVVIKNEKTNNTVLSIYPNPVKSNKVVLSFKEAPIGMYTLSIKNINGSIIHKQVYNQVVATTSSQIFLAIKPTMGWYVLSMINAQGVVVANKTFIVE